MSDLSVVAKLVACAGYAAYANSLCGNQSLNVEAYFKRARNPQVGDLVIETSTRHMKDWPGPGVGWLILSKGGGDYEIDPLDEQYKSPFAWGNAEFVAVPSDPFGFPEPEAP